MIFTVEFENNATGEQYLENACGTFRQCGMPQRLQDLGRGALSAEVNLKGPGRKM